MLRKQVWPTVIWIQENSFSHYLISEPIVCFLLKLTYDYLSEFYARLSCEDTKKKKKLFNCRPISGVLYCFCTWSLKKTFADWIFFPCSSFTRAHLTFCLSCLCPFSSLFLSFCQTETYSSAYLHHDNQNHYLKCSQKLLYKCIWIYNTNLRWAQNNTAQECCVWDNRNTPRQGYEKQTTHSADHRSRSQIDKSYNSAKK